MTRIIVAGCGRVGEQVATMLNDRGHTVCIIDVNEGVVSKMRGTLVDTIVQGNISDSDTLEEADVESADYFVALTDSQSTNVQACRQVRERSSSTHLIARRTEQDEPVTDDAVDDVVYPEEHGAKAVVNCTSDRGFRTLEDIGGDIELIEVRVSEGSPAAEQQLSDIMFPSGARVISDSQNNAIATGDTVLEPGETYLVAVETNMTDDVRKLFRA